MEMMKQIFVRGSQQHVLECFENDSVLSLKDKLSQLEGVQADELLLYACGEPLSDECVVADISSQIIDLNVGLLGGKVHGSLARAGKVKGQTPKVEKQEKKKKKTGRAKRRFQYNRRFVNIVQGFGRKRGPNAAPS
ncbi:40S ribosomal protein S30 [Orchesella cincta]|uniref:40S ribosomal protein S30 n=1 Tax=Orchesella cincta TaxID=48709 RepID=A0A1D2NDM4_ORCCI|nr:40S ribosomal protein S30 [Orchesella cincta]